jgi:VanZ family protein
MKENFFAELQLKKLWLMIGWSLVIAVVVMSLIPPLSIIQTSGHGDKVGHVIAYFVLMGWFAQIYHSPQQRFRYLIGFLLLGIGLEILQGFGGIRRADWLDIFANSIGVFLAWYLTKNRFANLLVYVEQKFCG